jgi:lipopolysaccharide/colanic/teichoic acid biosynthesis glycosyltransferase
MSVLARERVLILGLCPQTEALIREVASQHRSRHAIVGVIDDVIPLAGSRAREFYLGGFSSLQQAVADTQPHRIVATSGTWRHSAPIRVLFESYVSGGLEVEEAHEFYERVTGKIALESLSAVQVMTSGCFRPSKVHSACARALSLMAALLALLVLAPLMVIIALAITLDSRGPVLFAQRRVGAHGRPFTLLKFRTMVSGPARRSEWAGDNLDHVTRVGRWLRRFRLDELPQFVNILRGEMNLVGPRPHPVSNLALFTLVARNLNDLTGEATSCYALRLMVRPGLTGWAQVRYRYANNLDEEMEKLRYDLFYIKRMSVLLDLRILLDTFRVLGGRVSHDATVVTVQPHGRSAHIGHVTRA